MTPIQQLVIDPKDHIADEHCIVDPHKNVCIICDTYHGALCPDCGCRAFHAPSCPTLHGYEVPQEESDVTGWPSIGPGRLVYTAIALGLVALYFSLKH
jgi:hypothetical protein